MSRAGDPCDPASVEANYVQAVRTPRYSGKRRIDQDERARCLRGFVARGRALFLADTTPQPSNSALTIASLLNGRFIRLDHT